MRSGITALILFGLFLLTAALTLRHGRRTKSVVTASILTTANPDHRLRTHAATARQFALQKGYNPAQLFLIDMSLPSGKPRFFVYDGKKDSVVAQGLVTHGRCNEDWLEGRRYGNTVGCGCSSLGRYRVGYAYNGRFGLAFKLYGLDSSNSRAFERFVVLHAHSCVPENPVDEEICQSDGCPTVSPGFLQTLRPIITGSRKPILLWIFD